jgi:DNA processing protein
MSEGTNNLIKSGALPVTSADDILFALGVEPGKHKKQKLFKGSPLEEKVLKLIMDGTASQEELAVVLGIDGSQLGPVLTMLEINGHIRPAGGGFWLAV